MNRIIFLLGLTFVCFQCTPHYPSQTHEVVYTNGQPTTVVVHQPDGTSFFMAYMLFNSMYNNGGYTQINNYYNTNRGRGDFSDDYQRRYRNEYDAYDRTNSTRQRPQESRGFNRPWSTGSPSRVTPNQSNGFSRGSGQTPTTNTNSPNNRIAPTRSSGFGSSTRPTSAPTQKPTPPRSTPSRSGGFKRN